MAYEFKKLSAVEVVETPADTANVLIEENGKIKKTPSGVFIAPVFTIWFKDIVERADSTKTMYVINPEVYKALENFEQRGGPKPTILVNSWGADRVEVIAYSGAGRAIEGGVDLGYSVAYTGFIDVVQKFWTLRVFPSESDYQAFKVANDID
jgi:hypothetical protein